MPYVRGNVRLTSKGLRVTKGYYRSPRGSNAAGLVLIFGLFVVGTIIWILKTLFDFVVTFFIPIAIIAGAVLSILGFRWYQKEKLKKEIAQIVAEVKQASITMDDDQGVWDQLKLRIEAVQDKDNELQELLQEVYRHLVVRIAGDGKISGHEKAVLRLAENSFGLTQSDSASTRREGFVAYLETAVADNKITVEEEGNLKHLIEELDIDMQYLGEEKNLIAELIECREILLGRYSAVITSLPMKDDEKCYFDSSAEEMTRRKRNGEYYFEEGGSGAIFITSERIIFKSVSVVTLPLKSVLEARVSIEDGWLEILKQGRVTPYFFKVDQPRKACALIEALGA